MSSHAQSGSLRARRTKMRWAAEMTSAGSASCEVRASISAPWAATVSTQDGLDDRLLALKVVVEGAEADVRLLGDLLNPRVVHALASDEGFGGLDQLCSGGLPSA